MRTFRMMLTAVVLSLLLAQSTLAQSSRFGQRPRDRATVSGAAGVRTTGQPGGILPLLNVAPGARALGAPFFPFYSDTRVGGVNATVGSPAVPIQPSGVLPAGTGDTFGGFSTELLTEWVRFGQLGAAVGSALRPLQTPREVSTERSQRENAPTHS